MTSDTTSHYGVSSSQPTDPLPEDEYEVEKIVGKRTVKKKDRFEVQYNVEWKGYTKLVYNSFLLIR